MPSVRSHPEVTHKKSGNVAQNESTCFCHVPMVWLAVETAENMAVLSSFNSNVTFISELLYFLWKLKTLKKQGVSFLLETKHKGFFLF